MKYLCSLFDTICLWFLWAILMWILVLIEMVVFFLCSLTVLLFTNTYLSNCWQINAFFPQNSFGLIVFSFTFDTVNHKETCQLSTVQESSIKHKFSIQSLELISIKSITLLNYCLFFTLESIKLHIWLKCSWIFEITYRKIEIATNFPCSVQFVFF